MAPAFRGPPSLMGTPLGLCTGRAPVWVLRVGASPLRTLQGSPPSFVTPLGGALQRHVYIEAWLYLHRGTFSVLKAVFLLHWRFGDFQRPFGSRGGGTLLETDWKPQSLVASFKAWLALTGLYCYFNAECGRRRWPWVCQVTSVAPHHHSQWSLSSPLSGWLGNRLNCFYHSCWIAQFVLCESILKEVYSSQPQ